MTRRRLPVLPVGGTRCRCRARRTGPQLDAARPARVDVGVEVNGAILATPQVQVHGPGDVLGIDPRQIIRTEPTAGTTDFEPNYFAHLELAEAALPWLFTPAAPTRRRPAAPVVRARGRRRAGRCHRRPREVLPVLDIRRPAEPRIASCPTSPSRGRGSTPRSSPPPARPAASARW